MADGDPVANDVDYLRQVDRLTGVVTPTTPIAAGTQSIEAVAWSLDFLRGSMRVNANQLGTLDTATGLFTARASTIASTGRSFAGPVGPISTAYVDGISFDPLPACSTASIAAKGTYDPVRRADQRSTRSPASTSTMPLVPAWTTSGLH